jgi:hypothetical protein
MAKFRTHSWWRSGFPTWPFSSRSGLAGVLWFALVLVESSLNLPFGLVLLRQVGLELRVTGFADPDCFAWVSFYDPKIAFWHRDTSPWPGPIAGPMDFKRHRYLTYLG